MAGPGGELDFSVLDAELNKQQPKPQQGGLDFSALDTALQSEQQQQPAAMPVAQQQQSAGPFQGLQQFGETVQQQVQQQAGPLTPIPNYQELPPEERVIKTAQPEQAIMQGVEPPKPKKMPKPTVGDLEKEPIVNVEMAPGIRPDTKMSRPAAKSLAHAMQEAKKSGIFAKVPGPRSAYRTPEMQESIRHDYPNVAAKGVSNHQYGFAVDINTPNNSPEEFEKLDAIMEKYGYARPFPEKDPVHYSWQPGIPLGTSERVWSDDDPRITTWMDSTGYEGPFSQREAIRRVAGKRGLSDKGQSIFLRMLDAESGLNSKAVSPAGAVGIGQMMAGTAATYLADRGFSPEEGWQAYRDNEALQVDVSAEHFHDLLKQYDGNAAKALAAYNGGQGAVEYAERNGGWPASEDPSAWSNETANYVARILDVPKEQAIKWVAGKGFPSVETATSPYIYHNQTARQEAEKNYENAKLGWQQAAAGLLGDKEIAWYQSEIAKTRRKRGEVIVNDMPTTIGMGPGFDPNAGIVQFMTDSSQAGVRGPVEAGRAKNALEVRYNDFKDGMRDSGAAMAASAAFMLGMARDLDPMTLPFRAAGLMPEEQSPILDLAHAFGVTDVQPNTGAFAKTRNALEFVADMFPKTPWHQDVESQLQTERGNRGWWDYGWYRLGLENPALAGQKGYFTPAEGSSPVGGALGMEVPYLAGAIMSDLMLGPEALMSKAPQQAIDAVTTPSAGLRNYLFDKFGKKSAYNMMTETEQVAFRASGQTHDIWDVLGTLGGMSQGYVEVKRQGGTDAQAMAGGILGGFIGFLGGHGLAMLGYGYDKTLAKVAGAVAEEADMVGIGVANGLREGSGVLTEKAVNMIADNVLGDSSIAGVLAAFEKEFLGDNAWSKKMVEKLIPTFNKFFGTAHRHVGVQQTIDSLRESGMKFTDLAGHINHNIETTLARHSELQQRVETASGILEQIHNGIPPLDAKRVTSTANSLLAGQEKTLKTAPTNPAESLDSMLSAYAYEKGGITTKERTPAHFMQVGMEFENRAMKGAKAADDLAKIAEMRNGNAKADAWNKWVKANSVLADEAGVLKRGKDAAGEAGAKPAIVPGDEIDMAEALLKVNKQVKKYVDKSKEVYDTADVSALQVAAYRDAQKEFEVASKELQKSAQSPIVQNSEEFKRSVAQLENMGAMNNELADWYEANFEQAMLSKEVFFGEQDPLALNPDSVRSLDDLLNKAHARLNTNAQKEGVAEHATAYAKTVLDQHRRYVNQYLQGRPYFGNTNVDNMARDSWVTNQLLSTEGIRPRKQVASQAQYLAKQRDRYTKEAEKLAEQLSALKEARNVVDNPDVAGYMDDKIAAISKQLDETNANLTESSSQLDQLRNADYSPIGVVEPKGAADVANSEVGGRLVREVVTTKNMLKDNRMNYFDPQLGLAHLPGVYGLIAADIDNSIKQVYLESNPFIRTASRYNNLSVQEREALLLDDVGDMLESVFDEIYPSRKPLKALGANPNTGVASPYKTIFAGGSDAISQVDAWMPSDVAHGIEQAQLASKRFQDLSSDEKELRLVGSMMGEVKTVVDTYSRMKQSHGMFAFMRRAENTFRNLVHMHNLSSEVGSRAGKIWSESMLTLPKELTETRGGITRLKPEMQREVAMAIDMFPEDGGASLRKLVEKTPSLRDPVRVYYGFLRGAEQMKVLSPNLGNQFRDSVFFHMWPEAQAYYARGKNRVGFGPGTTLSSEHRRMVPNLAVAEELNAKFHNRIDNNESVTMMRKALGGNKPLATKESRRKAFLGMDTWEQLRVLGVPEEGVELIRKDPTGSYANQIHRDYTEAVLGAVLENPVLDPGVIIAKQIEGMFKVDAQRTALDSLANLHIVNRMHVHENRPIRAIEHYPSGTNPPNVPIVPRTKAKFDSLSRKPFEKVKKGTGPSPAIEETFQPEMAPMLRLSDDKAGLGMEPGDMVKIQGKEYRADELYIHPDVAEAFGKNFQNLKNDQEIANAFIHLQRFGVLGGTPAFHTWNLMSNTWRNLISESSAALWDQVSKATTLRSFGDLKNWSRESYDVGQKAIRDVITGTRDLPFTALAGHRIAAGEAGIDPMYIWSDMMAHGVQSNLFKHVVRDAQKQALKLAGDADPALMQETRTGLQRAILGHEDLPNTAAGVVGEGVEIYKAYQEGDKLGMAQAATAMGVKSILATDEWINTAVTFEPARLAMIYSYVNNLEKHWAMRGPQLLDAGYKPQEALSIIKQEVASEMNRMAGVIPLYQTVLGRDTGLDRAMYEGFQISDNRGVQFVGRQFSAARTPGWWRSQMNELQMAMRSGTGLNPMDYMREMQGRAVDPEVQRYYGHQWANQNPEYNKWATNAVRGGAVFTMSGMAVAAALLGHFVSNHSGYLDAGHRLREDPHPMTSAYIDPFHKVQVPGQGSLRMLVGLSEILAAGDQGKGRMAELTDFATGLGINQASPVAKSLMKIAYDHSGIGGVGAGRDVISDTTSWDGKKRFIKQLASNTLREMAGPLTEESFGWTHAYGFATGKQDPTERFFTLMGIGTKTVNPYKELTSKNLELVKQQKDRVLDPARQRAKELQNAIRVVRDPERASASEVARINQAYGSLMTALDYSVEPEGKAAGGEFLTVWATTGGKVALDEDQKVNIILEAMQPYEATLLKMSEANINMLLPFEHGLIPNKGKRKQ